MIHGYSGYNLYYSNGYWYQSVGNNEFVFIGKDVMFADEPNFKA